MSDATTPSADLVTAHKELAAVLLDEFKDPTKPVSARRACDMVALAMAVAVMQNREDHARFKAIEQELAALKTAPKGLDYRGIWQRAVPYQRNEGTTHKGSLWICLLDSARGVEPGTSPATWQLAAKGGDRAPRNGDHAS